MEVNSEDEDDLEFSIHAETTADGVRTAVVENPQANESGATSGLVGYNSGESSSSDDESLARLASKTAKHEANGQLENAETDEPKRKKVRFSNDDEIFRLDDPQVQGELVQDDDMPGPVPGPAISIPLIHASSSTIPSEEEILDEMFQRFEEDIQEDLKINVEEDDIALAEAEDAREEQFQNELEDRLAKLRNRVTQAKAGRKPKQREANGTPPKIASSE